MFKGCTFDNQNVNSKNDGGLYQAIFPGDGILWGCSTSITNDTVTIQPGEMIIGGRLIWVDGATQIPFSDPIANGYGQVILTIDLSKTATTSEFEQVEPTVVYSTTTTFPELTQGDINGAGGDMIYQKELVVVSIAGGNITGITRQIGGAEIDAEKLGGQSPSYYGTASAVQAAQNTANNAQTIANNALPKSGGTITNNLGVEGTVQIGGALTATGDARVMGTAQVDGELNCLQGVDLKGNLNFSTSANQGVRITQGNFIAFIYNNGHTGIGSLETDTTTAAGNVYSNATGTILRSTSSIRRKSNIKSAPTDNIREVLQNIKVVEFNSLCASDDPDLRHTGFIAEQLAKVDSRIATYNESGDVEGFDINEVLSRVVAGWQVHEKEISELKEKAEKFDKLAGILVEKGILTQEEIDEL